jgi:hypothetical protein
MGPVKTLSSQLADLNSATWKVDGDDIALWGRRPPMPEAPLELRARYAFVVVTDLVRQAVDHSLPIKLDY